MPQKVNVSGSRPLRKGSRKGSKKNSRKSSKHGALDFTSILTGNDKDLVQVNPQVAQQVAQQVSQQGAQQGAQQLQMPNAMANVMGSAEMGMQMMGMQNPMAQFGMQNMQGQEGEPNLQQMIQMTQMGQSGFPLSMPMNFNGKSNEIDPMHIHYMVPQNQNINLNNYGISVDQLSSGVQQSGLSQKFQGRV